MPSGAGPIISPEGVVDPASKNVVFARTSSPLAAKKSLKFCVGAIKLQPEIVDGLFCPAGPWKVNQLSL
ncbi:hypothetical protein D3C80_1892210 [compost metagenome]